MKTRTLLSYLFVFLALGIFALEARAACYFDDGLCRDESGNHYPDFAWSVGSAWPPPPVGPVRIDYSCCSEGAGLCTPGSPAHGWLSYGTNVICDGVDPSQGPVSPLPNPSKLQCPGSIISVDDQSVGEVIPINGTSFQLTYQSSRQIGYAADKSFDLGIFNSNADPSDTAAVSIAVGNQSVINSISGAPYAGTSFTWNGLDASSQPSKFGASITASASVSGSTIPANATLFPSYPIAGGTMPNYYVGGFNAGTLSLGGWGINVLHSFDRNRGLLYLGAGSVLPAQSFNTTGSTDSVSSLDGSEVYIFDLSGKHLSTKSSLTGAVKYTFTYSGNYLQSIADTYGNSTSFAYSSGNLVGITAPYGQTTTISTSSNKITSVFSSGIGTYSLTYNSGNGLLQTFTKPSGEVSTFTYDAAGRLLSDSSSAGPSSTLARADGDVNHWTMTLTSNLGRVLSTSISTAATSSTGEIARTSVEPTGVTKSFNFVPGATMTQTSSTLANISQSFTADPRFLGSSYLRSRYLNEDTVLSRNDTLLVNATLNSSDPFDINTLERDAAVNGSTYKWISKYVGSTKKFTFTSPVGRISTKTIDALETTTQTKDPSSSAVNYTYDSHGRPWTISQSARTTTFGYNTSGLLSSVTDPMSQMTSFTYDGAGRVLTTTLPDSRVITYTYDAGGNLASVTPPSSSTHSFTNNLMNFVSAYQAPSLGSGTLDTLYSYSSDKELTQITRPSGSVISFSYDATTGRLGSVTSGLDTYSFTYLTTQNGPQTITSPDGVVSTHGYVGALPKTVQYSGAASGLVTLGYDNFLHLTSFQIGSGTTYTFLYDNDELLNKTGSETLTRSTTTGQITATSVGNGKETYTYDPTYGELASYQAKYSTTNKFLESYTRDGNGRIATRTVTIGTASADVYAYTYDAAGRLTDVTKNAASIGHYVYDSNSNRTSSTNSGGTFAATYDAEDRLSTYGTKTFGYNLNGERTSQVDSSTSPTTTSYTWDAFGNLKQVTLPSTTQIKYQYDGLNRKVTKLTGSTVNERYVYLDQTKLLDVLNSSGATVMTFFYGVRGTPEYMIKSGTTYKFFVDHVGSVRQVINTSTGVVSQELTFDEFGRVLSDSSPGFQPFGFAGGLYDSATGLTQFGARWYDAQVGRFLSKDPILFAGGSANLYGYVVSDPINLIDPSGLSDINVFPKSDPISAYDNNTVDSPGSFSFGGHGDPTTILNANGSPMTPADVAKMIQGDKRYSKGQKVQLNSCSTGGLAPAGEQNFAQQLSNVLGATVEAPTTALYMWPNGTTGVKPPGVWKTFTPIK